MICKYLKVQQQGMLEEVRKKFPYFFLIIISLIMIFIYICFFKLLILDFNPWSKIATIIFQVIYHIVLLLLIWSIIECIRKDPGKVPLQWGFSLENQSRKYCLICHVFKPERAHHCSACNRCVLNMDHHCPWINSCIGFHNRKAFLLMLTYTILMTLLDIIAFCCSIPQLWDHFKIGNIQEIIKIILIVGAFILNTIIFITILLFYKFHIELVLYNMTTLQTLEIKRQGKNPDDTQSIYNIGKYYNWVQVFGRNHLTWPIPIFLSNEGPSGDGVLWPKKSNQKQNINL